VQGPSEDITPAWRECNIYSDVRSNMLYCSKSMLNFTSFQAQLHEKFPTLTVHTYPGYINNDCLCNVLCITMKHTLTFRCTVEIIYHNSEWKWLHWSRRLPFQYSSVMANSMESYPFHVSVVLWCYTKWIHIWAALTILAYAMFCV
jgi:hypothetical protein